MKTVQKEYLAPGKEGDGLSLGSRHCVPWSGRYDAQYKCVFFELMR